MIDFILTPEPSFEMLANKITDEINSGQKEVILLVPEQSSFVHEKEMLKVLGNQKFKKLNVISFSRLYDFLSQKIGIPSISPVSDARKIISMSMAIERASTKLLLYKKNYNDSKLSELMLDTLAELKSGKISDEDLEKIQNSTEKNLLKQKVKEIQAIKFEYENIMKNKYFDLPDLLGISEEIVSKTNFFENYIVFVNDFTGFTAQQFSLMKKIISQSAHVHIFLPAPKTSECFQKFFSGVHSTIKSLKLAADEKAIPYRILSEKENSVGSNIHFLAKNIFSQKKQCSENISPSNIKIYVGNDIYDEINFVAHTICHLIFEEKYNFNDITVVARNLDSCASAFKNVFGDYHIPCFMDCPEDMSNKNIINLILAMFDCVISNFSSEDVLRCLKSGLVGFVAEEISVLENYFFVWNIGGSDLFKPFTMHPEGFDRLWKEEDVENLKNINLLRERIAVPLKNFKLKLKNSAKGISKAVYEFFEEVSVAENLKKHVTENYFDMPEKIRETSRLWDTVIALLDEMSKIPDDFKITPKKYREIFSSAINFVKISEIPQLLNSVTIGSADKIRIGKAKVVFLVGALEGEFPLVPTKSSVFTDNELKDILALGMEFRDSTESFMEKEEFLIYNLIANTSEKLFVSYSSINSSYEEAFPSELITEIKEIFPKISVLNNQSFCDKDIIWNDKKAFEEYSKLSGDFSDLSLALDYYFKHDKNYVKEYEALKYVLDDKKIVFEDKQSIKKLIPKHMIFSATQIEKYYSCPFEYFCKYIIKAKKFSPASIGGVEYGNMIHFVFEKLFKKFDQSSLIVAKDAQIRFEINSIVNEFTEQILGVSFIQNKRFFYQAEKIKKTLFYLVNHLKEDFKQSSFICSDLELEISEKSDIKPVVLTADDDVQVSIEGKVDRVDIMKKEDKSYIRVVDYKTGNKTFNLSDVLFGLNMQMLIYLDAIEQNGKKKYGNTIVPAGALYFKAIQPLAEAKNFSETDNAKKVLKSKLCMDGIVLENDDVIYGMEKDGNQIFVPVFAEKKSSRKKNDALVKLQDMKIISKYVKKRIIDMANNLNKGIVSEKPICAGQNECIWCDYFPICRYEKKEFINVKKVSMEKSLKKMSEELDLKNET